MNRGDRRVFEVGPERGQVIARRGATAVAGQQMINSGRPREEDEINWPPLRPHRGDGQRRAVLVLNEQQQFARANLAFQRHGQVGRRGLAFHRHAVNDAARHGLLADGIFQHLRHRQRHRPGEEGFGCVNVQVREVQIRRAEIECEPGRTGIFVALGDGDGEGFVRGRLGGGGVNDRAGKGNRRRALVIHGQPQPGPQTGRNSKVQLARAVGLSENRPRLGDRLPAFAVGGGFNPHRFDEAVRRTLQRDAVQWLGESGFERDDRRAGIERDLKRFRALNRPGGRRGVLNQIRQFVAVRIVEPQIFERGAGGIESCDGQTQFHEAGRGDFELLRVLPLSRQRRGDGSGEWKDYEEEEQKSGNVCLTLTLTPAQCFPSPPPDRIPESIKSLREPIPGRGRIIVRLL